MKGLGCRVEGFGLQILGGTRGSQGFWEQVGRRARGTRTLFFLLSLSLSLPLSLSLSLSVSLPVSLSSLALASSHSLSLSLSLSFPCRRPSLSGFRDCGSMSSCSIGSCFPQACSRSGMRLTWAILCPQKPQITKPQPSPTPSPENHTHPAEFAITVLVWLTKGRPKP